MGWPLANVQPQFRLFIIKKAKDLSRGILGLIRAQDVTLNAFAEAGKTMLRHLSIYNRLQEADQNG